MILKVIERSTGRTIPGPYFLIFTVLNFIASAFLLMIAACFYVNGALKLRQAYFLNRESGNVDRNRRLCIYTSTRFAVKGIDVIGSILLFFVDTIGVLCAFGIMKEPMTNSGVPVLAVCAVIGFFIFAFIPSCCDVIEGYVEDKRPTQT